MSLDSLTFVSESSSSTIEGNGFDLLKIDMSKMQGLPQILGNTDPLHVVKLLPGVQTLTEFNSNINIRGCDAEHNDMIVGGVPLFGVNHLLGLFSVFNPSHYRKMSFSTSSASNRLGGTIEMELPDTLKKPVSGDFSVGMISTQSSLGFRIGKKSHLVASFRQSYLNLLYSRWMKIGDSDFEYNFGDYNITYIYADGDDDKVWADVYLGWDKAAIAQVYGVGVSLGWGNYKTSLHWEHDGGTIDHRHCIYSSGYGSECNISQAQTNMLVPSHIMASGYKGSVEWNDFVFNGELNYYDVLPQSPSGTISSKQYSVGRQHGLEAVLYAEYDRIFADNWEVKAGLKGTSFYNSECGSIWSALPKITLKYNAYHAGKITASYGWSQQNLFYTGVSNSGLPIEFWFMAGMYSKPQYAQWGDLSYDLPFFRNMFSFSCSLYVKRLYNQVEYRGDLMDLFTSSYDLNSYLLKGKGLNAGVNVMFHKQSGNLTGWVSYSFGRALRKFDNPDYSGWYPASHERIHELNAVASYNHREWDFSGTFIYATGLPFTAPESYYLSSGHLVADFGDLNACRMRPYIRLDLSVSRSIIKNENQENGINLSVGNVLARDNDVMYKLKVFDDGGFVYARQSFVLRIIPSISYYHKF